MFQVDETRLPYLEKEMRHLTRKLMGKFVSAKTIWEKEDITQIPFKDPAVHLENSFLASGLSNWTFVSEHGDEFEPSMTSRFFDSVKRFYIAAVDKLMKTFPFKDPVVNGLEFLLPSKRHLVSPSSVTEMGRRFPSVISTNQLEDLEEEFRDFQLCSDDQLPKWEDPY